MTKLTGQFLYELIQTEYNKLYADDHYLKRNPLREWDVLKVQALKAYNNVAELLNKNYKYVEGYETKVVRYEFTGSRGTTLELDDVMGLLNSLGVEGWKLVSSTAIDTTLYVFFQRKKGIDEE